MELAIVVIRFPAYTGVSDVKTPLQWVITIEEILFLSQLNGCLT